MPPAWPRPRLLLLLLSGFAIPAIPLYHTYRTFQLEWADIGSIFDMLLNLFEDGYVRYYDLDSDYLRYHFSPFLYLLALPLKLVPRLLFLLGLQVAALVSSAFALRALALTVVRSQAVATLLFFALLTSPYAFAATLYPHYDFFTMPALLFFYYFLVTGRSVPCLVTLVLALTIKEDVWVYALVLSFTQIGSARPRLVLASAAISVGYFLVGILWLWPLLYPDRQDMFLETYAQGDSRAAVLLSLLQHPWSTAQKLWTGPGLAFFSSLLFVPFLAPLKALCLLPATALWLNSTSPERSALAFHYSTPSLAMFAAILPFGLRTLEQGVARLSAGAKVRPALRERLPRACSILAVALILAMSLFGNVRLPEGLEKSPSLQSTYLDAERRGDGVRDHHEVGWDILKHRMKPGTSVIADFNLATYTRDRHRTYGFWFHRDLAAFREGTLRPDYVLYHLKPLQPAIGARRLRAIHEWMLDNRDYRLVYGKAEYYLFERAGDGD